MTEKGAYESILRELRKAKAPSLHLEDYNYWINKGIQEYINERYAKFEISQQVTDDLQPIMVSDDFVISSPTTGYYESDPTQSFAVITGKKYGSDYVRFNGPTNYWHMTGSNVTMVTRFPYKCYPVGYEDTRPSKKLSASNSNGIIDNAYLKPSNLRPYHDFADGIGASLSPDITIYFGDKAKYNVKRICLDYLKKVATVNLTLSQRDLPLDTSALMEFPDYVCNEIVKRCLKLLLENSSDARLQNYVPVNQTIQ